MTSDAKKADTGRELLERAARAAGIETHGPASITGLLIRLPYEGTTPAYGTWNPLTDDGDALRLAVKLGATVYAPEKTGTGLWVNVLIGYGPDDPDVSVAVDGDDALAATRLAIVTAAAALASTDPLERASAQREVTR